MGSIHILGLSNPAAQYLLINSDQEFNLYCYTSKNKKILQQESFEYSKLKINFQENDSIVSFIPIQYLKKYLEELKSIRKNPKSIIACSSTSIYSKVLINSPDSFEYQKFLIGEHGLMEYCLDSEKEINLIILRLSLLWGGRKDNNVNLIFNLLNKYRFFPLLNNANGARFPIHHSYLSETIKNIIRKPLNSGIYSLQGPESITYIKMIKTIKSRARNKSFLIILPKSFIVLLIRFFSTIKMKKIVSILMMIYRQENDLDFSNYNHIPNYSLPKNDEKYSFEELIKIIY